MVTVNIYTDLIEYKYITLIHKQVTGNVVNSTYTCVSSTFFGSAERSYLVIVRSLSTFPYISQCFAFLIK